MAAVLRAAVRLAQRHARAVPRLLTARPPMVMIKTGAVLAGLAASGAAVASCDPVLAMQALWTYVTVTRKDIRVRRELHDEILRVRNEFKLRDIDVEALYQRFHALSREHKAFISRAELEAALHSMGVKDSTVASSLFNFFDTEKHGAIHFHEFVVAISIFTHGRAADKAAFMHRICDRHHTGVVTLADLRDTIKTLLCLHARLSEPLRLQGDADWLLDGLDQIARAQVIANIISKAAFLEAASTFLSRPAFQTWVGSGSNAARMLVSLFDDLERQFTPFEAPRAHPPQAPAAAPRPHYTDQSNEPIVHAPGERL